MADADRAEWIGAALRTLEHMDRFCGKRVLFGVAVAGILATAFLDADRWWLSALFTVTFVVLVVATILARRPFCLGLAVTGWAYVAFTIGPFSRVTEKWLPSTWLAIWLCRLPLREVGYNKWQGPMEILTNPGGLNAINTATGSLDLEPFAFRVLMAQYLIALLLGCMAGLVAQRHLAPENDRDTRWPRDNLAKERRNGPSIAWLIVALAAMAMPVAYWWGVSRARAQERTQGEQTRANILAWTWKLQPLGLQLAAYENWPPGPRLIVEGGRLDASTADELARSDVDHIEFDGATITPEGAAKMAESFSDDTQYGTHLFIRKAMGN